MPAPLPPKPPVRLDGLLQARLSAAAGALGRLNGAVGTLSDADLLILMCARKEAVLSSRIEGTQSTLRDLLAAEAGRFAPGGAYTNDCWYRLVSRGPLTPPRHHVERR